jgi:nucleoside-diphosphate-sugar epimerase
LADDNGISTPDLIRSMARALGKPARLLPFPPTLLKLAGMAIGQSDAMSRLLESLQVDSGPIRRELGWRPRYDLSYALRETARWYYQRPTVDSKN